MGKKKGDQPLHEVIHEGNKWIKDIEKQLSHLEKLREKVSLNSQASTQVIFNTSASEQTFLEAQKELKKLDLVPAKTESSGKKKRRKRLGRAIHRKLRI